VFTNVVYTGLFSPFTFYAELVSKTLKNNGQGGIISSAEGGSKIACRLLGSIGINPQSYL
jgi:hypothetical protein